MNVTNITTTIKDTATYAMDSSTAFSLFLLVFGIVVGVVMWLVMHFKKD